MPPDEPPHPAPLPDERWAQLVASIRRYFPEDAEGRERESGLRRQVAEIANIFRDKETDDAEWEPRVVELFRAAMQQAPKGDRLVHALACTLPYITSTREEEPPLLLSAKKRLHEVHKLAAALSEAISAALADPWLDFEYLSEIQDAALVAARRFPAESELLSTPEVIEMVRAELLWQGAAPVGSIFEILGAAAKTLPYVADVAALGAELFGGPEGRGRPHEAPSRVPALFLAAVTRQHAPAPPPRGGIEEWRRGIVDFVCGVLAESGLPPVNREFLRRIL